jgi:hypothetical protein
VILVVHGVAGVAGASAIQLVLHEMVASKHLPSAIRLNASSRYLSLLLGPALGGGLMLLVGPAWGLLVNVLIYTPLTLFLLRIPYTGRARGPDHPRPASGGPVAAALRVLEDVRFDRQILMMIVLGGAASFFVGNAFQAQMPRYAQDLGADEAGVWYSILLAANAAGAVLGAVLLETVTVFRMTTRTSMLCAIAWGGTLGLFPAAQNFGLAVTLLVLAGAFDIAFTSSAQTLVQVHAPPRLRGRVVGVFNTAVLGLRAGSGITVGILGAVIDVNWSLALSAAAVVATGVSLLAYESTRVDDGRGALRRADGAK